MIGKTNASTTGGSVPPATSGDYKVTYINIDGEILKQQWVNSGQNATPPENPSYDSPRLVFAGYNQTSTNITSDRLIGATYSTVDNKLYAKISPTKVSGLSPTLYLFKSDGSELTVDWGDGTQSKFTISGNFNTGAHTYAVSGDYWITIWISNGSGNYKLGNGTSNSTFLGSYGGVYRNILKAIYFGSNITSLLDYTFQDYYSLSIISLSNSISSIGLYAISKNLSLKALILTSSINTIAGYAFHSNYTLPYLSITDSVNSIGTYFIQYCYNNAFVFIPNTNSNLGSFTYYNNYALEKNNIPTSLTAIPDSFYYNCYSLPIVSIHSSVVSIAANAFYNCFSVLTYKIYATTPPALASTNAFTNINSICKIYVPDASLTAYKTATNWATYAQYIYPLSDIGE